MVVLTMSRKRSLIAGAAVLVVLLATFGVSVYLNSPASGRLRHDASLRTTTVEKHWQVERKRFDACVKISFKGKLSGNARSSWGITGPTTVWENVRVLNTTTHVETHNLRADGTCEGKTPTDKIAVMQQWSTADRAWTADLEPVVFKGGLPATSYSARVARRLEGDSYDRGDAYETTLSVYVEPHWRRNGGSITDGFSVETAVELPVE